MQRAAPVDAFETKRSGCRCLMQDGVPPPISRSARPGVVTSNLVLFVLASKGLIECDV